MQITAYQHIFSNVPKDQSPTGRRGYQTLFYSQSALPQADLTILESRSQYFAGEKESSKYQYYSLPDGKVVISRSVPLPEPDEFGRKGRYLTHNLVITAMEFASIENNPHSVLAPKNFANRIEDITPGTSRDKNDLAPIVIEAADSWQDYALQVARSWPGDQLVKLARVGWQAALLQKSRVPVHLVGNTSQVLETLAIIFVLVPPAKRLSLSFDTYVNGCDWSRDWPFWVWGDEHADQGSRDILIDPVSHRVEADLKSDEDTPFEHWVATEIIPRQLENYFAYREPALSLDLVFQGKQTNYSSIRNIPADFLADFTRINSKAISRKIAAGLSGLSPQLINEVIALVEANPQNYLQWLITGINKPALADLFYQTLLNNVKYPLTSADRKFLSNLATEARHAGLDGLLQLNKGDKNTWRKILEILDIKAYQLQISQLLKGQAISTTDAFLPSRLVAWCEVSKGYIKQGDLKSVLDQLNRSEKLYPADALGSLWSVLSEADRQLLRKWVKTYKGYAPELHRFFDNYKEKTPSVAQKIGSIFSGSKKPGKK